MSKFKFVLFLDTCGNVWETCTANCEGAENFGPRYCAKPSTVHPDNLIHLFEEEAGFELFRPMTEEELSATEEWNRRHTDDCEVCEGTGCRICTAACEECKLEGDFLAGLCPECEEKANAHWFCNGTGCPLCRHVDGEVKTSVAISVHTQEVDHAFWAEKRSTLSDEVDAACKGDWDDNDIPF